MQPAPHQPEAEAPAPASQGVVADPPLLLGRYRVVETRGQGGFCTVRVCWDIRLERRVAIKCMPLAAVPGVSTSTLQEALDEARITSRLTHPNIVTVHDFEVVDDMAYLIMEYVDGLTLAELLARVEGGVLAYDECAHLLSCLANALAFAHENEVLHLDIKPSNVLVDPKGGIKLGDFGMASLASAAGWEGARGGTVGYMPPEQLEGGLVDERTDVFALAVVCYQALTGTNPFAAKDAEASLKRIERRAKPLAKVETELAGPVSDGIARALAADPSQRPSTVGEFADSVLPYLGDEEAGRASVADLMAQTTGETGPDEKAWEAAAQVRVPERWPWLPGALVRATSALVCLLTSLQVSGTCATGLVRLGLVADAGTASVVLATLPAVLAAVTPAGGGMLACALVAAGALATGPHSPAFLVALALAGACTLWWRRAGDSSRLAGAALLAPSALGAPGAGAAIAGAELPPLTAIATGMLGALLQVVVALVPTAKTGEALALACAEALVHPGTWLVAAGAALAAGACSLLGTRGTPAARVCGQTLCAAVLIACQMLATRVENGGIWTAGAAANLAVALVCSLLMSIAIVTLGPPAPAPKPREVE